MSTSGVYCYGCPEKHLVSPGNTVNTPAGRVCIWFSEKQKKAREERRAEEVAKRKPTSFLTPAYGVVKR